MMFFRAWPIVRVKGRSHCNSAGCRGSSGSLVPRLGGKPCAHDSCQPLGTCWHQSVSEAGRSAVHPNQWHSTVLHLPPHIWTRCGCCGALTFDLVCFDVPAASLSALRALTWRVIWDPACRSCRGHGAILFQIAFALAQRARPGVIWKSTCLPVPQFAKWPHDLHPHGDLLSMQTTISIYLYIFVFGHTCMWSWNSIWKILLITCMNSPKKQCELEETVYTSGAGVSETCTQIILKWNGLPKHKWDRSAFAKGHGPQTNPYKLHVSRMSCMLKHRNHHPSDKT